MAENTAEAVEVVIQRKFSSTVKYWLLELISTISCEFLPVEGLVNFQFTWWDNFGDFSTLWKLMVRLLNCYVKSYETWPKGVQKNAEHE